MAYITCLGVIPSIASSVRASRRHASTIPPLALKLSFCGGFIAMNGTTMRSAPG
jgi:hypothetical protein